MIERKFLKTTLISITKTKDSAKMKTTIILILALFSAFCLTSSNIVYDNQPSVKNKVLIKWSAVGSEEYFNITYIEHKMLLQKMMNKEEQFCFEYPLDSTEVSYVNQQIDQIMSLESNYYSADPDHFAIDGFKHEVYLMDKSGNTIRTILIDNVDLECVDNLVNFAINYRVPNHLGN
jgi:hypothetical protein